MALKNSDGSYGKISGIASSHMSIISNGGPLTEIKYGAWADTVEKFRRGSKKVPLMLDHGNGTFDVIGKVTKLEEKPDALYFEAVIETRLNQGTDALERVELGLIDSVSVSFVPTKAQSGTLRNGKLGRIISEAQLYELSLVVFPADAAAKIFSVNGESLLSREAQALQDRGFLLARSRARQQKIVDTLEYLIALES